AIRPAAATQNPGAMLCRSRATSIPPDAPAGPGPPANATRSTPAGHKDDPAALPADGRNIATLAGRALAASRLPPNPRTLPADRPPPPRPHAPPPPPRVAVRIVLAFGPSPEAPRGHAASDVRYPNGDVPAFDDEQGWT